MVTEPRRVTGSGDTRGRLQLLGAVAATPLVLAAVVVAALLGAPVAPVAPRAPIATAAAPAAASLAASPAADPVAPIAFPARALGLPVVDVATALDGAGSVDTVLAVRGYLQMSPLPSDCDQHPSDDRAWAAFAAEQGFVSSAATFCDRHASLRPWPTAVGPGRTPRLDVAVAIGAVLPDAAVADPTGSPLPVIVIGRLTGTAGGCGAIHGCERHFDVDRLVWLDGLWRGPTTSVEPALQGEGPRLASRIRDRLASQVTASTDAMLLETLVRPAMLWRLDPGAASQVATNEEASRGIWYRRSLDTTIAASASVRWVAIDDAAGTLLASGVVTP